MKTRIPFTKEQVRDALKGSTLVQAAKKLGISKSCMQSNASLYGLKTHYTNGNGPGKLGIEVIKYVSKHGVEKASKKFNISVINIKRRCWNYKFAHGIDAFNMEVEK